MCILLNALAQHKEPSQPAKLPFAFFLHAAPKCLGNLSHTSTWRALRAIPCRMTWQDIMCLQNHCAGKTGWHPHGSSRVLGSSAQALLH